MMAHFAIRSLIHEAALRADEDPDRISFLHTVRVVRRKLPAAIAIPPPRMSKAFRDAVRDEIFQERVVSSRNRRNPRGVKRKTSNFPVRRRGSAPLPSVNPVEATKIIE